MRAVFITLKSLAPLLLSLFLLSCNSIEEPGIPNDAIQKILGQKYYLSIIEYKNAPSQSPARDAFTFTIETESSIVAKILCNTVHSEMLWGQDGVVFHNEISPDKRIRCPQGRDPLLLEDKMFYKVAGRSIVLQSMADDWRATFIQENP